MQLVDAHRLGVRGRARPLLEPLGVVPLVGGRGDDGGGGRREVRGEGHRVGLVQPVPVGGEDAEAVAGPDADAGQEDLPDAGAEGAHRGGDAVPAAPLGRPVADDAHAAGVRGPHRERRALDRAGGGRPAPEVGAEGVPEPLVAALADQVQVDRAEHGGEAVGVVDERLDLVAVGVPAGLVGPAHREPVVRQRARDGAGEHAGRAHRRERVAPRRRARLDHHVDLVGARLQRPDDDGARRVRTAVGPEDAVRVAVRALEQQVQVELPGRDRERARGRRRGGAGHRRCDSGRVGR